MIDLSWRQPRAPAKFQRYCCTSRKAHFFDKKHFNVEDGAEEFLRIVAELCQTGREEA